MNVDGLAALIDAAVQGLCVCVLCNAHCEQLFTPRCYRMHTLSCPAVELGSGMWGKTELRWLLPTVQLVVVGGLDELDTVVGTDKLSLEEVYQDMIFHPECQGRARTGQSQPWFGEMLCCCHAMA